MNRLKVTRMKYRIIAIKKGNKVYVTDINDFKKPLIKKGVIGRKINNKFWKEVKDNDNFVISGIGHTRDVYKTLKATNKNLIKTINFIKSKIISFNTKRLIKKRVYTNVPKSNINDFSQKGVVFKRRIDTLNKDSNYNEIKQLKERYQRKPTYSFMKNKDYKPISKIVKFEKIRTNRKAISITRSFIPKDLDTKDIIVKLTNILKNPVLLKGVGIFLGILFFILIIIQTISFISTPYHSLVLDENIVKNYKFEVERLDNEKRLQISTLMRDPNYNDHSVRYMNENNNLSTNWKEILCLIAVLRAYNLSFSSEEVTQISAIYNQLTKINTRVENYSLGDSTYSRLIVEVYTLEIEDILGSFSLTNDQKVLFRRYVTGDFNAMYPNVGDIPIEPYTVLQRNLMIQNAPQLSITRAEVIGTAYTLNGKVQYFWGGKSLAGWNRKWGTPTLVTAQGSQTTGTYQAYGLDCSGFVDWVYKTSGVGSMLSAGGTAYQWQQSYPITEEELMPGDLAFKSIQNSSNNHVGLFTGKDSNGNNKYIHCTGGVGVVENGYEGFKFFRRAYVKFK